MNRDTMVAWSDSLRLRKPPRLDAPSGETVATLARGVLAQRPGSGSTRLSALLARALGVIVLGFLSLVPSGCQSSRTSMVTEVDAAPDRTITLKEGDVIRVTFPGTPALNTTQQIRRDGKVNLPLVGDVQAAGLTPSALEQEILRVYDTQLLSREVTVTLEASAFPVFVTGMVLRPGKVMSDHPLTLLEAIMEAGGFAPSRANLKAVRVMRRDGDQIRTFVINLKATMDGEPQTPFHLRPLDIVHVPERFSLF